MLSIGSMGGSGEYYLRLAQEDYYLEGGEPLGRWWGQGAEKIVGLGNVANDQLKALLKGFSPDGDSLVQNAGKSDRQQGWDLTFSAPKSVSVLWSQADEHTRREIQNAHFEAVKAALEYLQEEIVYTRRGKGGTLLERGGLVVATFEHGTSRELDPQLHTHALLLNLCVRHDGTTGSILSKPVFEAKMAAGALYRAELASQLERRIAVRCEREAKGTSFRVVGVGKELCDEVSKRRADIKDHLKSFGSESAAAAAIANRETRRTKQDTPPRSELFKQWQETGQRFGFDAKEALGQKQKPPGVEKDLKAAFDEALAEITDSQSHFTKVQIMRAVAVHCQDKNLSARSIRDHVKKELTGSEIVSLGIIDQRDRYTTRAVLKVEKSLIDAMDKVAARKHGATTAEVERGLKRFGQHLTDEQRQAVKILTERGMGVRSLEGLAGTGKTSTLHVVRTILEKKGYKVYGATLSAKAATELEKGAGIPSRTLASLDLITRKPSFGDVLKHEAKQVGRAFLLKDRRNMLKPFEFDKKTVLVIDESAMVATKDLAKLAAAVAKAGGMLISAFDRKQLQAIGPGGGAAFIADRHGKAELKEIVRQHEEWMRDAVRQFAKGDAAAALKQFELAGRLHVAEDRDKAIAAMVSDWAKNERGKRDEALIFVGTLAEVADVNSRCQAIRQQAEELNRSHLKVNGERFYHGDRVLFTKNAKTLGVQNGTLGTVVGINTASNVVAVKVDGREVAMIPLSKYKDIQLGYAVTTHKGQGTTIDNSYLLAGGRMQDLHFSYTQASRARETVRIYTDRNEAGDKLSQLAKQMSQDREKVLAHAMAARAQQEQLERERARQRQGQGI